MPPRKAATGALAKAAEPAAKKTRTTRGGAFAVAKPAPATVSVPDVHMHEDDHKAEAHHMEMDPQTYTKMNGYGSLSEEEMGWAELLKQGYDEQYEKGKMNGYSKHFALSDQVKTIDVSACPSARSVTDTLRI
jgi:hypothetical protein